MNTFRPVPSTPGRVLDNTEESDPVPILLKLASWLNFPLTSTSPSLHPSLLFSLIPANYSPTSLSFTPPFIPSVYPPSLPSSVPSFLSSIHPFFSDLSTCLFCLSACLSNHLAEEDSDTKAFRKKELFFQTRFSRKSNSSPKTDNNYSKGKTQGYQGYGVHSLLV